MHSKGQLTLYGLAVVYAMPSSGSEYCTWDQVTLSVAG